MKALTILYHDVVQDDFDESGFSGAAAARYKLKTDAFTDHVAEMARRLTQPAVTVSSMTDVVSGTRPFLMTVDDGGVCAPAIADIIEQHGWHAHFFVTTDFIDSPAFLSSTQIRDLHCRGHVIGSHSCSHPFRFSELPAEVQASEWTDSVKRLSDILGEQVITGSVPGGFYAPCVAEHAARAGIRYLFTSEPTTGIETVAGCQILGRYNVYRGMSAADAGAIVEGNALSLLKQKVNWEVKKTLKRFARPLWDGVRRLVYSK
ncbi:MAG: polysaccharide deacetylase family protein [Planctomycetaceae bacterium]